MQVVTLIILLFFCKASEFRKVRRNNRANNDKSHNSPKNSSTVKRYAPGIPCDIYTYINEKYLDCQEKKQTTVQDGWPEDLIHILLARNRIRIIKDNAFSKFQILKSLDLQQNEITKIEPQAFFGLKSLTTLLLQHNRIKILSEEVFIQMPRLNYLRLYDNPWDCNCELESLVTLLQIPRNRNFGNYAKCENPAELKGQKLKQITPQIICQEENGGPKPLEGSKVTKPSVDSTLCHTYLYPIATLDCRRKELQQVPTDISPDIIKLDLSSNKIKRLQAKQFKDVPNLEILNLSNNGIEFIDPAAFSGLMNLHELDLSENKICNFQYGVLEDLYFLKKLWLRDNPWRCDYHIHYLFYWLKHHYNVNYNGFECKEPEEYKGWYVGKYVRSYYEECPNERLQVHVGMDEEDWEKMEDRKQIESAKTQGVLLTVLT
ncbi:leucine-rich repeat-containing protein 17 [Bufo gargarizans]|uniref:leucine-rich repeat-containing protein 17 n=1 Tax=Bufo gargarizans TaxID=30331 RepID=UPI001CF4AF5B|nr:leucine-rich repeat-containing protein 17 [Bufo gargarizans]XP_044136089.1 leucine-rich repeat-containing protein 17 [Bufo gargarizans]